MIKILAIGNSFSQDAAYYLHPLARSGGVDLKIVNLYIGGCSLERHWGNIVNDASDYKYEENGKTTDRFISIKDAIRSDEWNYIVTQQASHDSGLIETYEPYAENIANYIREQAPTAELVLHETWAYEIDSDLVGFRNYEKSQKLMYEKLSRAYETVARKLGVRLIPSGNIVQKLRTVEPFIYGQGGLSLCRDGYHMHYIYGRYLLSAVWYRFFTGNSVLENAYIPRTELAPDAVCDGKILTVIKKTVDESIKP